MVSSLESLTSHVVEDRWTEHPRWLLTWLVLTLALLGCSPGARASMHVLFMWLGFPQHRCWKQGRAGLYPELAESLLPYAITSAATGLSVLKGVKQTSPGGSGRNTRSHRKRVFSLLWKIQSATINKSAQHSHATCSSRMLKPNLLVLFLAPEILFMKSFTWASSMPFQRQGLHTYFPFHAWCQRIWILWGPWSTWGIKLGAPSQRSQSTGLVKLVYPV